ncbi:DUF2975 domain-containing protein [Aurantiacibacter zhengii]|uniref:DUF2975 domain-containing protein n=1 Tax=Aurantiacibacter zhengii TaxID=2307003 RepID=A0A418NTQ1_9SPHN|nr:DUF2975 domain-containing protein [Aurantiacibacter zhengii]RIV86781.1 DUF2975 domain-containing protein [Aurantiacibacter zhengii]
MTDAAHRPNDLLLLAGKVLSLMMQGIMVLAAIGLLIAMPVLVIFRADIVAGVAAEMGPQAGEFPLVPAIAVMALALIAVALIFFFFGKLRQVIDTVAEGDPFVPKNADRLGLMAWLLLAVQLLGFPIAAIGMYVSDWAEAVEDVNLTFDVGIDIEGMLMVVILFILARVFRLGAAMRDDLEGTV